MSSFVPLLGSLGSSIPNKLDDVDQGYLVVAVLIGGMDDVGNGLFD